MKKDNDLTRYISAITDRFTPAENIKDATHQLSTSEIRNAIMSINPEAKISEAEVYQSMVDAGFKLAVVPGTIGVKFAWILIEKL